VPDADIGLNGMNARSSTTRRLRSQACDRPCRGVPTVSPIVLERDNRIDDPNRLAAMIGGVTPFRVIVA